jgi:hypothetical protein
MPKLLKDMQLDEISLVDEPASPGARVALFKRRASDQFAETANPYHDVRKALVDDGIPDVGLFAFDDAIQKAAPKLKARDFDEVIAEDEAVQEAYEATRELQTMVYALGTSIREIFTDPAIKDTTAAVEETVQQFVAAVQDELSNGEEPDPETELEKAMKPCADCAEPKVCKEKGACAMSDVNKNDEAIQKRIDEAVAKAKAEATEAISKANASAAEAIAKANGQIEEINKERAERADAERLAKAKTLVDGLPGMDAEVVAKSLKEISAEGAAALEKTLNAAREALKLASVTKQIGADATGGGKDGDANSSIAKAAAVIKAAQPTLTTAQAIAKALDANPELYSEYLAQR